jgi:3-dehydroquinate synthase
MSQSAPRSQDAGVGTVPVELGPRSYDVLIGPGLIGAAGELLHARFGAARCAIVTDRNLETTGHLARLAEALTPGHRLRGAIVLSPGEATKSFGELAGLCQRLLELGVERGDLVIALGGGVIGDLAGFAAAVLRRGVRYVQVPTTLLAQVDSSVGGKTGINTPQGKNLIGAFHQPSLVLADTDALASLPDREMSAGYAEVAKYGLLGDASFFAWLEANAGGVLARDRQALIRAVTRSVEMKAEIVARDETETEERMLLNLGHTFGHALEAWAGFSAKLLHGEAIAIGICLAFRFSEAQRFCPAGTAARVAAHLASVRLPTRISDVPGATGPDAADLIRLMRQDKKVQDGRLTFVLARDIGAAFVSREVNAVDVEGFLAREIARREP